MSYRYTVWNVEASPCCKDVVEYGLLTLDRSYEHKRQMFKFVSSVCEVSLWAGNKSSRLSSFGPRVTRQWRRITFGEQECPTLPDEWRTGKRLEQLQDRNQVRGVLETNRSPYLRNNMEEMAWFCDQLRGERRRCPKWRPERQCALDSSGNQPLSPILCEPV